MSEAVPAEHAHLRRERWIVAGMLSALVLARSLVFLIWPTAYFDSDQAVFGLMATHISEGRAWPMFMYGQNYILAVEAWMAAPLFLVAGPSLTALKLPLLAVNLAILLLLLRILEKEVGLRPAVAAIPLLFFALPPPGTAAYFLEPSGGNLEPFLYVLLIWMLRTRPNWAGLVLGVGFLHREFTLYGLIALLAVEAMRGTLFTRAGVRTRLIMLRAAAEVWLVVQFLKQFASAAGPGTSVEALRTAPNNLQELANRICVDPQTLMTGASRLVTTHWPNLFGSNVTPLRSFSIESHVVQGLPYAWLIFASLLVVAVAGISRGIIRARGWDRRLDAGAYLALIGLLSSAGYVAARCGVVDRFTMRYELLSVLGIAGAGVLLLGLSGRRMARLWMALAIACASVAAVGHTRLWLEYLNRRPVGAKEQLVKHVEAYGITHAYADYWVAYYVTFLTDERVIVASEDFERIAEYKKLVEANREKAVRIARAACPGSRPLGPFFHVCRLDD